MKEITGTIGIQELKRLARDFVPKDASDPEKVLQELLALWRKSSSVSAVVDDLGRIVSRTELQIYETAESEIKSLKIPISDQPQIASKEFKEISGLQLEISAMNRVIAGFPAEARRGRRVDDVDEAAMDRVNAEIEAAREKLRLSHKENENAGIGNCLKHNLQILLAKKLVNILPKPNRKFQPGISDSTVPGMTNLDEKSKISVSLNIIKKLAAQDQQAFLQRLAASLSSNRNFIFSVSVYLASRASCCVNLLTTKKYKSKYFFGRYL